MGRIVVDRTRRRKQVTNLVHPVATASGLHVKKENAMLQLLIIRKYRKADYTIGQLYVNGQFKCNTLEDTDRRLYQGQPIADIARIKVKKQTAIPTGTYRLQVSESPKFKRELIEVLDVPGFSGIRIHRGNTAADSEGCILPGVNNAVGRVSDSTKYELELTKMVKANPEAYLTII